MVRVLGRTTHQLIATSRCTRRLSCSSGTQACRWGGWRDTDIRRRGEALRSLVGGGEAGHCSGARLARRVSAAAERAQRGVGEVDAAFRAATRDAQRRIGPVYEVDDEGNRRNISHRVELSEVEQRKFRAARGEAVASGRQLTESAVEALAEELAVLQMMGADGRATAAR